MLCTAPRSGNTAEHNITPAEQTIRRGVMPAQATLPGTTPTRTPSGRSDGCPASTWTTDTPASRRRESRPKRRDFWKRKNGAASSQSFPVKPMRQRRGRSRTEQNRPYAVVTRVHGGGQGAQKRPPQSGSTEPELFPSPQATPEKLQAPCPSNQGNIRTGVPPAPTTRVSPSPSHTPAARSGKDPGLRGLARILSGSRRAKSTNQLN